MNSVLYCVHNLSQKSHLRRMEKFTQHGDTSCLLHTIAVAYYSIKIAEFFGIKYKKRDLIRGALLHDYFLYDWHDGEKERRIHGFTKELVLPESIAAPVEEGQSAGVIQYSLAGKKLGEVPVLTAGAVKEAGFLDYFKRVLAGFAV